MENSNKKKILIVDDDDNLRLVLSDKLKMSRFDVVEAQNGKEGLDMAIELHPDLILLDILMPIMNGQEMLKKLREDEWGKTVKVVMLTVIEEDDSVAQAVEGGSIAYLIKSSESMDSIVDQVKTMLK